VSKKIMERDATYPLNTCTNENGNTGSVTKCARGPLHLRRVAMNFVWNPFSLIIGCPELSQISPPLVPLIFKVP